MAVSMAKLGKLDAICAKLQKISTCMSGDWPVPFQSLRKDDGAQEDSENNNVPPDMVKHVIPSPSSPWQQSVALSEEALLTSTPLSQGRRKSRKAAIPRNLTQVQNYLDKFDDEKDELTEYKINNQDTDFPPLTPDNEAGENDQQDYNEKDDMEDEYNIAETETMRNHGNQSPSISRSSFIEENSESKDSNSCDEDTEITNNITETFSVSDEGALDLSLCKSESSSATKDQSRSRRKGRPFQTAAAKPFNLNVSNVTADEKQSDQPKTSPKGKDGDVDVAMLKNYAENTMNEFLSMFGLHGETAESLTGQVPLQNFSTRKILDQNGHEMSVMSPSTALSSPILPFPMAAGKMAATFVQKPAAEGVYARNTAETVSRLAQLPEGTLIGNPQVLLPSNIQTVLQLVQPPPLIPLLTANHKVATKPSNSANYLSPASAAAAVSAVVSPVSGINSRTSLSPSDSSSSIITSPSKIVLPDYSKYIKRYNSAQECGGTHCQDLAYREHFHCLDCNFRVFVRKEEMIRHFKWHKKRDDSLQHGFMRYSPMDDCSKQFGVCTHNSRQTHYHCLQHGCDKVYISTSDVQMHANYHRKDSAIIQEGFQRFRATEDCGSPSCAFYGQRTTHFHCRRASCRFTFKNKADMEKHKSYHQKDEILGRDGFKKFMKYEHCPFPSCRFSKVSNHIHCIRPGCDYVLHSTGQLYSHKRKHERRDFECAYRRFKDGQKGKVAIPSSHGSISHAPQHLVPSVGAISQVPSVAGVAPARIPVMVTSIPVSSASAVGAPEVLSVKKESEFVDLDELSDCKFNPSEENSHSGSASPSSIATSSQSDGRMDVPVKAEPEDLTEDSEETDHSKGLAAYAEELSEDQLNDSLTLPIPKYAETKSNIAHQSPPKPNIVLQSPPKRLCTPTQQDSLMKASPAGENPTNPVPSTPERDWPTKLTISMEKKPKDESWKAYLVRYTANDPCNSRCQYLYKDHYHCKVDNCTVLFKSKDAVREHARYHELQDRITSMAYNTCEKFQVCPQGCEYSLKEKHYHCIWAGCTHVILETGSIFNRLEHYRIHEYARAAAGKGRSSTSSKQESPDFAKRRRGRPPKYPRTEIPVVPKVELSEEELLKLNQSQNESPIQGRLISSFKKFVDSEPCPDELCIYYTREHFHCARPRCHHATDREDVLNLHTKDFHSFVNILEGFEFFDRNVNCRRPQCHNNKANRHFHCVRPKCDYSFVRHTTMAQHDKKHKPGHVEENMLKSPRQLVKREYPNFVPIAPAPGWRPKTVVKAAGTFYPISTINSRRPPVQPALMGPALAHPVSLHMPIMTTSPMITTVGNLAQASHPTAATSSSPAVPLTVLLQKKAGNTIPLPNWSALRAKMHFTMQENCGRPFCKLKKKDHYHCLECNQAFSDPARLRSHIGKHGVKLERADSGLRVHRPIAIAPKLYDSPDGNGSEPENLSMAAPSRHSEGSPSDQDEPEDLSGSRGEVTPSSSLNLNPSMFHTLLAKSGQSSDDTNGMDSMDDLPAGKGEKYEAAVYQYSTGSDEEETRGDTEQLRPNSHSLDELEINGSSRRSSRKRSAPKKEDFVDSDAAVVKQRRLMSPESGSEEEIPNGYMRYRFCDDCHFDSCVYRKTVTHFHCTRPDCHYSFSNRTRMVQHTLRHERIDGITGDEFRQYRGNVDCQCHDCEYSNKSSHFHCLMCPYVCTDAAQVLAHRKHHQKLNNISSQGFKKFSGTGDCNILTCTYYYKKQTHYHCTQQHCTYAVLAPSQMAPHRLKHLRERV